MFGKTKFTISVRLLQFIQGYDRLGVIIVSFITVKDGPSDIAYMHMRAAHITFFVQSKPTRCPVRKNGGLAVTVSKFL